ncbi:MAG: response regulator [Candidatus Omnitrophica bacterium]|nr:response regulator [Candidatus Omnitrophota bacterium]
MDSLKILLVDDDKDFSGLIRKTIESWGYEVMSASSGNDALDTARKYKVDVIILDYLMPDMDGVDTLKELRKIDEKVPVIMFTSLPDKRSMEGTEKLGVLAYIPKVGVFTDSESSLKTAIELANRKRRT